MRKLKTIILALLGLNIVNAQPLPPGAPAVVITEIFYDMPGVADSLEFIELTNPSDTNQRSLAGYTFTAGVEFTFPLGLIIEPREVVVVAKDAGAMFRTFGVDAYQWDSGDLSDLGEAIVLTNNFGQPTDSVFYQTNILWPSANGNGNSIVFCNDTLPNEISTHWTAAATNTGVEVDGTTIFANPGTDCTNWVGTTERSRIPLQVYPNPNTGAFFIELPNMSNEILLLSIYNQQGAVVSKTEQKTLNRNRIYVDSALKPGIYMMQLTTKTADHFGRLVIME